MFQTVNYVSLLSRYSCYNIIITAREEPEEGGWPTVEIGTNFALTRSMPEKNYNNFANIIIIGTLFDKRCDLWYNVYTKWGNGKSKCL